MNQNKDKLKKRTRNALFSSDLHMKGKEKIWKTII